MRFNAAYQAGEKTGTFALEQWFYIVIKYSYPSCVIWFSRGSRPLSASDPITATFSLRQMAPGKEVFLGYFPIPFYLTIKDKRHLA